MARIRTIKPEFWSDEKLSPLDPITRLVFLGLIGMADDLGRTIDNAKIIDAFIFPNTSDTSRDSLATLSRIGRVIRGKTASGQSVIQIVNWDKHQKVDKPNIRASLPEIVEIEQVTEIRESVANPSRNGRECLATHTNDQRPATNDLGSTKTNTADAPKASRFVKPTVDEVRAYCDERRNRVDPQTFLDHYESNGWRVGKNPMKDWKAAVRTWERNDLGSHGGSNSNHKPRLPTDEERAAWVP